MRKRGRAVAGAVLAGVVAVTVTACGDAEGTSPRAVVEADPTGTGPAETRPPEAGSLGSDVRLVDAEDADLVLYASNQSFEDETVRMRITVDGVVVADQDFEVGSQHSWHPFPLDLAPGAHEVLVVADSGVRDRNTVRIPRRAGALRGRGLLGRGRRRAGDQLAGPGRAARA